jgi:hypothetical protein
MSDQPKPNAPHVHVVVDEPVLRGSYVNMARIFHQHAEFVIDGIFHPPATNQARVVSRLVMSPVHAKHLLRALAQNIARYEQVFGEIRLAGPGGEAIDPILH